MFLTVFALALLAHLINDFLLQTDKMAQSKKDLKSKSGWRAMLTHIAVTFVLNVAAFYFLLSGWQPLLGAVLVTAAHLCIDILKNIIRWKNHDAFLFVLDQALHAAIIALIVNMVVLSPAAFAGIYSAIKPLLLLSGWNAVSDKVLWTIIAGLACIWGGACFIRALLNDLHINFEETASAMPQGTIHAGKLIGILERIAILILIPLNQWAAVGLLLTAKSVARHKYLDNKTYAEYYLIGTLLSFIIAVVGGLVIAGIW